MLALRENASVSSAGGVALALCALLIINAGCGDGRPARVPVAGRVTIDGQPVPHGAVTFMPVSGPRPAGGQLDSEGRFQLSLYEKGDGVPVGEYRVAVTGVEYIGEVAQKWHAPQKYSSVETSGLTATIDGPKDDFIIELTWDGGKPFTQRLK